MATIEIRMLGDFEIRVNGKPVLAVLGQSRKTTALVQYLVLQRGERVSLFHHAFCLLRCIHPVTAVKPSHSRAT